MVKVKSGASGSRVCAGDAEEGKKQRDKTCNINEKSDENVQMQPRCKGVAIGLGAKEVVARKEEGDGKGDMRKPRVLFGEKFPREA